MELTVQETLRFIQEQDPSVLILILTPYYANQIQWRLSTEKQSMNVNVQVKLQQDTTTDILILDKHYLDTKSLQHVTTTTQVIRIISMTLPVPQVTLQVHSTKSLLCMLTEARQLCETCAVVVRFKPQAASSEALYLTEDEITRGYDSPASVVIFTIPPTLQIFLHFRLMTTAIIPRKYMGAMQEIIDCRRFRTFYVMCQCQPK